MSFNPGAWVAGAIKSGSKAVNNAAGAVTTAVTGAVTAITEEAKRKLQQDIKDKIQGVAGDAADEIAKQIIEEAAAQGIDLNNPNDILTAAERLAKEKAEELKRAAEAKVEAAAAEAQLKRVADLRESQAKASQAAYKELYQPAGGYTDPYNGGSDTKPEVANTYSLVLHTNYDPSNTENSSPISVDLPFVYRITMQAPNAVSRTRNLAGAVYAEHAGFMQRTFTLEGRSGAVWNASTVPNNAQQLENALAISRFTTLRNFLETYGKEHAANKNAFLRYKNARLEFKATFESESLFCDVVNFSYRRSAGTNTYSFEYTLTLVTNGFAGASFSSGSLLDTGSAAIPKWINTDFFFQANKLSRGDPAVFRLLFDGMPREAEVVRSNLTWSDDINLLKDFSCSAIQDIRVATSMLNSAVETSVWTFNPTVTRFTSAIRARAETKAALAWSSLGLDVAHSLKGLGGTPCPVPAWSDLYYTAAPYVNAGNAVIEYVYDQLKTPKDIRYSYTIENTQPTRLAMTPVVSTSFERPFAAVNHFLSLNGADAYSAAAAVLGDRNAYPIIIRLNNLRDAHTRADGTPLSAGSSLLVPDPEVPASRGNDVLGTDLLLVNGDLALVGNNDVMRVSGYANYTQNLLNRMRTPRGTNRVFPRYGLSPSIHRTSDSTVPALIRTDVTQQVMQDHRTKDVGNFKLTMLGDKVQVSMVVTALTSPQRTFTFNYGLNSEVTQ
jgi:hypothetical protein